MDKPTAKPAAKTTAPAVPAERVLVKWRHKDGEERVVEVGTPADDAMTTDRDWSPVPAKDAKP